MFEGEIEKKYRLKKLKGQLEKWKKIDPSNSQSRLWDYNNFIKSKLKNNYEIKFVVNLMFKSEIKIYIYKLKTLLQ